MNRNILYPDNVEIRLLLERAWNLAASDRLTWFELENLGLQIQERVDAFKKENDIQS